MNKKELKKNIKKYLAKDVYFKLELYNKIVTFQLYGFDNREVCLIEIPYNNVKNKREIYNNIFGLIKCFDFSFRVCFDTLEELKEFLR